jgi:hypothetical protein
MTNKASSPSSCSLRHAPRSRRRRTYYQPQKRGDGTNPWGYTDNKLRDGSYFVASTYWDQRMAVAMFDRRAGELCGRDGFSEFTFSRELMYAVAVSPAAYFPQGQKPQGERIEGVTREAIVNLHQTGGLNFAWRQPAVTLRR